MATYSDILTLIETNLASGNKIPAVKHREVEIALLDYIQANLSQSGDIKVIKADVTYLNDNFEVNGLGKNLRAGWAICNGNNGTDNIAGRVIVGYGLGYSSFGAIGGSTTASVTSQIEGFGVGANTDGSPAGRLLVSSGLTESGEFLESVKKVSTPPTAQQINIMQPYIVQLYIMKL